MAININGTGSITGLSSISSPTISGGSVPLGDATAPGIVFSGDANTGIYSPGADQVAISTNSTGRLFIDSSGRVGVGTSSPSNDLDVLKTASGSTTTARIGATATSGANNATLILNNGGTGNATLRFDYEGSTNRASIGVLASDQKLTFGTAGSTAMTIDASQRVGIGTTSPAGRLHVSSSGTGTSAGSNIVISARSEASGRDAAIQFADGTTSAYVGMLSGAIYFADAGSTERARIDSSGRLLVGTSSSSASAAAVLQGFAGSPAGQGILNLQVGKNTAATAANENLGSLRFANSDGNIGAWISGEADLQWNSGDYPSRLVFSTTADGASSPTERVRITNSGRLRSFGSDNIAFELATSSAAGTTNLLFSGNYGASGVGGGTESIRIFSNGNVQNTNNSYGAISDIKLKENIVDASSQWDDLKALQIRKYNFKEGQTHTQIGLVAQEVELVSPGLVSESPDRDEDGNDLGTVTKSVNYSVLYMKAVKALQEAMERIETLEAKVAALESA